MQKLGSWAAFNSHHHEPKPGIVLSAHEVLHSYLDSHEFLHLFLSFLHFFLHFFLFAHALLHTMWSVEHSSSHSAAAGKLNTTLNPLVEEDFFTSNEFAPMRSDDVTYPPLVSVGENLFGLLVINGTLMTCPSCFVSPFKLSWGIFPAAMREEAEAALTDSSFGLNFVLYGAENYNWLKALAVGDVAVSEYNVTGGWTDVEKSVRVVPVPDQTCWAEDKIYSGPCPRPEA